MHKAFHNARLIMCKKPSLVGRHGLHSSRGRAEAGSGLAQEAAPLLVGVRGPSPRAVGIVAGAQAQP